MTVLGEKAQATPKIGVFGHTRVTGLDALLAGATVIAAMPEFPAVMDELGRFAETLKSGMFTVMFAGNELL